MEKNAVYEVYEQLCIAKTGEIPILLNPKIIEEARIAVFDNLVDMVCKKQFRHAHIVALEIKLFDSFMYDVLATQCREDAVVI